MDATERGLSFAKSGRGFGVTPKTCQFLRAWAFLVCCVACASLVAASAGASETEVELAPSVEGYIGAWLVSGPIPELGVAQTNMAEVMPLNKAHPMRGAWWPGFRPVSSAEGAINLARDLKVGVSSGPSAIAGVEVVTRQEVDAWLLLSCDGAVSVYVDGKRVFARDSRRRRDGSWDAVSLELKPGVHRLVMLLEHRGEFWAFEARLLDKQSLNPPAGVRFRLPGTNLADRDRLVRQMLTLALKSGLDSWAYRPELEVRFERGVPDTDGLPVSVTTRRGDRIRLWGELALGEAPVDEMGVAKLSVQLPRLSLNDLPNELPERYNLDVQVGAARRRLALTLDRRSLQTAARAQELLAALRSDAPRSGALPPLSDAPSVAATLEYLLGQLQERGTSEHWERQQILEARAELDSWLDELAAGYDPLRHRHGVVQMARRSRLDGSAQPIRVHIPQSFQGAGSRRYPLVVALHGYNGSGRGIMNAFLDTRQLGAQPKMDGFVIAPRAFGNSFYMGPGEQDVMDAIEWAQRVFPIDSERISITGVSMGGTGTAGIALKYADRFSAVAPLCGYHSYFIRRDVTGRRTRPWETARLHHWSTSSWSENALLLPFYVAHGTHDLPLKNSRVLTERFHELGYSMRDEWPDAGHRVWELTYKGGRLWPWLTNKQRAKDPKAVRLKTDQLRYGKRYWVELLEPEVWGQMSDIGAQQLGPSEASIKTDNVRRLRLWPEPSWPKKDWAAVTVDGQSLSLSVDEQQLVKVRGRWTVSALKEQPSTPHGGATRPLEKNRRVAGPIRDVFNEPLLFSYGTLDPSMTRANREVASALTARARGSVAYPIMADVALTAEQEANYSIVAVGNSESHALLAGLSTELPIVAGFGVLRTGKRRLEGSGLGATYVYPNPRYPDRYLLVVVGTDAPGIWRALSLPKLLPDFLVYDARLGDAAGQQVLGDGQVIGGGYFLSNWHLPEPISDPFANAP